MKDTLGRENRKWADKKCLVCGTIFKPKNGAKSKYCSRACLWSQNKGKPGPKLPDAERQLRALKLLHSHIDMTNGPDACWPWKGPRTRGYGIYNSLGGRTHAHVAVYRLFKGPIPHGKELDHLCRNTSCVNPSHLEPVTHRENILRGNTVPAKNANKTHCKHGHEFSSENTRTTKCGARACRKCDKARHKKFAENR